MQTNIPKALYEGDIVCKGFTLHCAVLDPLQRVFTKKSLDDVFKKHAPNGITPENHPTIKPGLLAKYKNVVEYVSLSGKKEEGIDVEILHGLIYLYLGYDVTLYIKGIEQNIANGDSLLTELAYLDSDIQSQVDAVTGYGDFLMRESFELLLEDALPKEAKKIQLNIPIELYQQWFELNNMEWNRMALLRKVGIIENWTVKYLYNRMPPELLKTLDKRKSTGYLLVNLNEIKNPDLREFYGGLLALGRASTTWKKYTELIERAYSVN